MSYHIHITCIWVDFLIRRWRGQRRNITEANCVRDPFKQPINCIILATCIRLSRFSDRFISMLIGLQPCASHTDANIYLLHLYVWDAKGCDKRLFDWLGTSPRCTVAVNKMMSNCLFKHLPLSCVGDSVCFLIHDCQVSCQSHLLKHKQVFVRVNRAVWNADTTLPVSISYIKCPGDAGVHVLTNFLS